jgi:uncharacterized membrane protein YqjE
VIHETTSMVGDLRGVVSTGVRAVRTRLELIAIELREEKAWVVRSIVAAVASLYLLTFAVLLGIFALALWASEANRPAILAGFAGAFLIAGLGGVAYIVAQSKKRHPIFQDTLSVLKGDEKALERGQVARGTSD